MKLDPLKFGVAALVLAGIPCEVIAAPLFQDLSVIDAAIVAQTGQKMGQVGGAIGPVDRRLKLARCPEPVQIDPAAFGAVAVRCAPLGWRIRITLVAPPRVPASAQTQVLAPEIIVKRGESVELRVIGDGFQVAGSAVAMEDGALGAGIRVKSPTSKTPVTATIVGPAAVKISP